MRDKKWIFEQVAKKYHTTPDEVYSEIQKMIHECIQDPNPAVRKQWEKISPNGEVPTPEELIDYSVNLLKEKNVSC